MLVLTAAESHDKKHKHKRKLFVPFMLVLIFSVVGVLTTVMPVRVSALLMS